MVPEPKQSSVTIPFLLGRVVGSSFRLVWTGLLVTLGVRLALAL